MVLYSPEFNIIQPPSLLLNLQFLMMILYAASNCMALPTIEEVVLMKIQLVILRFVTLTAYIDPPTSEEVVLMKSK